MKLLTIVLLCALSVGCGYGSNYNSSSGSMGGGVPTMAQLSPASVNHGSPDFTLTITGTNFTSGSVVYWGTTALTAGTSYYSSTQVSAAITSSMVASPGSVSVYVHSAGGNSNAMTFTIN